MFTGCPGAQPMSSGNFGGSARGRVSSGNKLIAGLAVNLIGSVKKGMTTQNLARTLDAVDRLVAGSGSAIDLIYACNLMKKIDGKTIDSLKNLRDNFSDINSHKLPVNENKTEEIKAKVVNNLAFRHKNPDPPPKKTLKKTTKMKTPGLHSVHEINING